MSFTSISKYLGKEEVGKEKVVNLVCPGDQTKKKINLGGCFSREVCSCKSPLTTQMGTRRFMGRSGGLRWLEAAGGAELQGSISLGRKATL